MGHDRPRSRVGELLKKWMQIRDRCHFVQMMFFWHIMSGAPQGSPST
jgi:hypothetical protein